MSDQSPQSVVVPVDELEDAISDAIGDSMDMDWTYRDGAKAVLSAFEKEGWAVAAAPAPSSLAGGEVLKVFPPETTDVQSRYVLVHQLRASADIQDGETKREKGWATTSDRARLMREAADAIECLAALSPEAPARERVTHPDAQPFERFPELALHIERMAMTGLVGSGISWDAFLRELNAALTPRHEAPAEGAGLVYDAMLSAAPAAPQAAGVGDDELIERGLRTIRAYDTVRYLRDALTATTARLTSYDWNADPDGVTKQQGDAFAAADKVFADLDAAVASHPEIELPECQTCGGTGKIEEAARTEGANQHSACVRTCDDCDGCGFAPDDEPEPLRALSREPEGGAVGMKRCIKCGAGPLGNCGYYDCETPRNTCPLAAREEAPVCEMCNGRGEVGGPTGQTPESFEYVTERCPDCGGTGKHEAPAEGAGEREALIDCLGQELADAYDCKRVWSAWSYGTMAEDDFVPVAHRIDEVADAILALRARSSAPEARDD